jgi:hypothetical protein
MCREAGLKSYRVTGLADNTLGVGRHAWNLVVIQGQNFLIESTWASCNRRKAANVEKYYLPDEKEFGKPHWAKEIQ